MQGDVVYLVDELGQEVAYYTYDPFGKVLSAEGDMADVNPLRYRGYYYDAESGFYYLQSRYYDPTICRYINADSYLSTGQGFLGYNAFAYCGNNPVNYTDSSGNFFDTIFDIISIGFSIAEVIDDPSDPWAWAGLAGDLIDLIPFVSGVGEVTKAAGAVADAVDIVDDIHDATKVVDAIDNIHDTGKIVDNISDSADTFRTYSRYTSNDIGKAGERLAGITPGSKTRFEIHGRTRIPDYMDDGVLKEVKNVAYISNTLQLRDYAEYAELTGRALQLWVRPTTKVARTVIEAGWEIHHLW